MGLDLNNGVVDNLLEFLPEVLCAFYVNLTRDVCIGRNGNQDIMKWLEHAATFEQLRDKLSEGVLEGEYRDCYYAYFNREYLLRMFEEGVHEKSVDVQCRVTTGEIHWVRITARLLRNEGTGEVESLIYAVDVNDVVCKGGEGSNLAGSLSNVYFSSHYINLTEDTFKELKAPESSTICWAASPMRNRIFRPGTTDIAGPPTSKFCRRKTAMFPVCFLFCSVSMTLSRERGRKNSRMRLSRR